MGHDAFKERGKEKASGHIVGYFVRFSQGGFARSCFAE